MRQYDTSVMKIHYALLVSMLSLISLEGCIKEDRSSCPCRFLLDFSDVDTSVVWYADISMTSADGFDYSDELDASGFEGYMVTVPRTNLNVCAWAGAGYCLNKDMSVTIPYGEECPRLYLYVSDLNADCEMLEEKIVFRKNHCVLTIRLENWEGYPFGLTVRGKIDGYGRDLKPSVGRFACRVTPDSSGNCVVVLPRQLDSSLVLDVDDGTGSVRSFAIGEHITAGGYDWNAADLDDVTLVMDYSLTDMTIEIMEWDSEQIYDIVI